MPDPKVVLDGEDMRRALTRIAHEIVENGGSPERLALVGIHRRGALLAGRLRELLAELHGIDVPLGDLDISFYRDDVALREGFPVVHATHLDFDVDGRTVVIVDDVLFTGRTVRAAIEALFDYGRPARVQLAVLADRGHRELPLRPDYVGKNLPTARSERVYVRVAELDGEDSVTIGEAVEDLGRPDAAQLHQDAGLDAPRDLGRPDAAQLHQDAGLDAPRDLGRPDAAQLHQDAGLDAPRR
jgi:pyrimidine operon attenuation protein/uracil phosphoribosyltransferase